MKISRRSNVREFTSSSVVMLIVTRQGSEAEINECVGICLDRSVNWCIVCVSTCNLLLANGEAAVANLKGASGPCRE
jgi:hypothetical protein